MRVRLIQNEASEIRKNASAEAVLIAAKAEADAKYKVRIVHRGGKGGGNNMEMGGKLKARKEERRKTLFFCPRRSVYVEDYNIALIV